jgi:ferredoxin
MAEGSFGGHTPRCTAELCLNQRHKGTGCSLCVDHCPTGAIQLTGNRPALDPDLCVQCGTCLVICPTEVFSQTNLPELTLTLTFQHLPPAAPLELVCPLRSPLAETQAPVVALVRHPRCLASLSIPHLLDLSNRGERSIWLDDSLCVDCPFVVCHNLLCRSVAGANELLSAFGRPPALALHTTHAELLLSEPATRPLLDGMKPQLSRRGFFGALRQMGQERMGRALVEEAPPMLQPAVVVDERLPRRLPHSRKELLALLTTLTVDSPPPDESLLSLESLPFASVAVDADVCSACGLCARFCPTGALAFVVENPCFQLGFQPATCIDCEICVVVCPEDAIQIGDRVVTATLVSLAFQSLHSGELASCYQCGVSTTVDGTNRPLCSVCRLSAGAVGPLQDEAGLMADLLSHLPNTLDQRDI